MRIKTLKTLITGILALAMTFTASAVVAQTASPAVEVLSQEDVEMTPPPLDVAEEGTAVEATTTQAAPVEETAVGDDIDAIVENELCHAQFFGDGTPEQAIIHCTRALEAGDLPEGDMVTAHVNRGVAYKLTGQLDEAIEDYTKALELSPESGDIYTTRANAFLEMAQLDAAINDANKALAFNPNYAAAYFVRGRIFEALGQKGFARDDFVRAYELAPDNKDIEEKAWAYGSNQN
ncbi:tetratricopeptide repeat protein [Pyruvatibacter sp.]